MGKLRVWSGGDGTGGVDNTNWAQAYNDLQSAITAASAGDEILIHYTGLTLAANTTYTFAADVVIYTVDKDNSEVYTAMGTGNSIGHTSTAFSISMAGAFKVRMKGITLRIAGSTSLTMVLAATDGSDFTYDDCYFWHNTGASSVIGIGTASANGNQNVQWINCRTRFGHTGQVINTRGRFTWEGGSVDSAGSVPTTLFTLGINTEDPTVRGVDVSHVTGTLVGTAGTSGPVTFTFDRSTVASGVTPLAAQTPANRSAAELFLLDCSVSGGSMVTGFYGHYNELGKTETETSIYYTGSPMGSRCLKITTTSLVSQYAPYVSPWVHMYHDGTSAITPRFECLRNDSATAFADNLVWAEWLAKTTSTSPRATFYSDRVALGSAGSAQAAGAGLSAWTGEGGSAASFKCDSGASLTPAVAGDISGRLCVGAANASVYWDAFPRTA